MKCNKYFEFNCRKVVEESIGEKIIIFERPDYTLCHKFLIQGKDGFFRQMKEINTTDVIKEIFDYVKKQN